jgi:hypothetical protein
MNVMRLRRCIVDLSIEFAQYRLKYKEENMSRFLALGVALFALVAFAATAQAQYPEPEDNLTPQGPTSSEVNNIVQVVCVLRSASGAPVANQLVYFEIVSGPPGARLNATSGLTNSSGQVTVPLFVGTAAGTVRVLCSDGDVEAFYVGQVLGARVQPFTPPSTGDAGLAGGSTGYELPLVGTLVLAFGALFAARRVSASR